MSIAARRARSGLTARVAVAVAFAVFGHAAEGFAQSPFDPTSGVPSVPQDAPPQSPKRASKALAGPETGAAAGGDRPTQLPTEGVELPENPTQIPEGLAAVIGSDFDPEQQPRPDVGEVKRSFYGVYYEQSDQESRFRSIFPPLWIDSERAVPGGTDDASLYGLNYFRRRSPRHDADIVFPFFWNLRDDDTRTTILGPVVHRHGPEGHDNWVAPIFFEGARKDGGGYLHIPPLLTFHDRGPDGGFSMVGPMFCSWKGGAFCDGRTATELTMGVAPIYFYGRDAESEWELIPPLLRYSRYAVRGQSSVDVWGPVYRAKDEDGESLNVLPFYFQRTHPKGQRTTVVPFFHYATDGAARTLATPLFFDHVAEDGAHTFATYLYARHRGRTELDMFSPLVWLVRDPDIGLERTFALPFFYRGTSPRVDELAIFPFYGHFKRNGVSNTRWVTPLVRHETSLTGWQTDVYPFFYSGRTNQDSHVVIAPVFWDFSSPTARKTVVFPLYWRFADTEGTSQLAGNTFYSEKKVAGGSAWQFHFFPLVSFGGTPRGHFWNVLYGLAGFEKEGTMAKMRIGYVPIQLSDDER
ncbi:MAG: hypothetical protein EXR75_14660 [Myxococcales bacterium]|nr:hypothetical protein [Myxococcales bacterium]